MEENETRTDTGKKKKKSKRQWKPLSFTDKAVVCCSIVIGLLALGFTFYDGSKLHIFFMWRLIFFVCLIVFGLYSIKDKMYTLASNIIWIAIGAAGVYFHLVCKRPNGTKEISWKTIETTWSGAALPYGFKSIMNKENGTIVGGVWKQHTESHILYKETITTRKDGFGWLQTAKDDPDGFFFIGMLQGNTPTLGILSRLSNWDGYIGEFLPEDRSIGELFHGRGIRFYGDGKCSDGHFSHGKETGWCYHYYPDGTRLYAWFKEGEIYRFYHLVPKDSYVGWFKGDTLTGYGRYYYAKGGCYQGWFKNGKFHGPGYLADARRRVLAEKDWNETDPHGSEPTLLLQEAHRHLRIPYLRLPDHSIVRYPTQQETKSQQSETKASPRQKDKLASKSSKARPLPSKETKQEKGDAFLTQPDPSGRRIMKYRGRLVGGKPEGQVEVWFENGDWYNGMWHRGLREGYGEIRYANGEEYKGEWKADKRTGKGAYFKGANDYVKGDFVDGKPHGLAIHYVKGVRVYNGRWVHGVPQKSGIRQKPKPEKP